MARKAPLWAIALSVLATTGLVATAVMTIPSLNEALQSYRDFSVSASPSPITVQEGSAAATTVTIASQGGYNLATALTTTLSPTTSSISVALSSLVVTPTANSRTTSTLTILPQPGTPIGTYTVSLTATGGTKSHTISITIIVAAIPDFTLTASPAFLTVFQNSANSTTLTLTSVGGFAGNVSLTLTAPFATLGVAGGRSPLRLNAGGTNTTTLAVYPTIQTQPGSYAVSVTGTSGILVHTVNIPVTVNASIGCNPCGGTEALTLESYSFSNTTSVTLYLRNTGTLSVSLVAYYVRDASGDQYFLGTWAGPTISVNALGTPVFGIGASCTSCTLSGTAFTFTAGNTYTITIVTSRNTQFIFTVVR